MAAWRLAVTVESLVEDDLLKTAKNILKDAESRGVTIYLPTDTIIADAFDNNANKKECTVDDIPAGWMGLDIGKESCRVFEKVILASKTILWNGPMGVFEMESFATGTKFIIDALVKATKKGTFTLVGGGDSVAAINKYDMAEQVSYVSTGGGAMLEFIEGKELPGVAAIENA